LYFKDVCGFNVHDTMIYEKCNFAHPEKSRYHQIFEYVLVLSRRRPKTFNPLKDKKNIWAGTEPFGVNNSRQKDGTMTERPKNIINENGMRGNVWRGKTSGNEKVCKNIEHPATMPLWLAKDHIISWSNSGDTVLDCFMGSGTTGVACKLLRRNFIGCEIDKKYFELAKKRIDSTEWGLFG